MSFSSLIALETKVLEHLLVSIVHHSSSEGSIGVSVSRYQPKNSPTQETLISLDCFTESSQSCLAITAIVSALNWLDLLFLNVTDPFEEVDGDWDDALEEEEEEDIEEDVEEIHSSYYAGGDRATSRPYTSTQPLEVDSDVEAPCKEEKLSVLIIRCPRKEI
ncbi:hypothetical protein V6N13_028955 [Hibiscus sabdariffa]|uniref:Uncharacterized protein n=2 Tax=Hibiscus sabdariffa TaxID=183260 RepID=A0ABR2NRM5_9ROSI